MAIMMMIVILIVGITCDIAPIAGLNHNPTATAAIGRGGGGKTINKITLEIVVVDFVRLPRRGVRHLIVKMQLVIRERVGYRSL